MRRLVTQCALAAVVGLVLLSAPGSAAPALAEQAARWEYAELTYRRITPGNPFQRNPRAAQPEDQPAAPKVEVRWITAEGETEATGWDDLGAKLKAPAAKKDATATMQRLHLFNHLGGEGWELVGHDPGLSTRLTSSWMFKRRVP